MEGEMKERKYRLENILKSCNHIVMWGRGRGAVGGGVAAACMEEDDWWGVMCCDPNGWVKPWRQTPRAPQRKRERERELSAISSVAKHVEG